MIRRTIAMMLITCLWAVSASAGIYYEAVTTTEGKGQGDMGDMKLKAWVEGENAKVEFHQSKNPMLEKGTYLLTHDGGKTMYLVNPKEKTYSKWDMQAMMNIAGGAMGMVKMEISDPEVEQITREPGPEILGYPTTYHKSRISYETSVSVIGMKSTSKTMKEQEIWATTALTDPGLNMWLRDVPKSGNEDLDNLIEAEMETVEGIPLKTLTVTTTTDTKKNKSETSTMTMEVTKVETKTIPDSTFEIPEGYEETQLFPMGQMGSQENTEEKEDDEGGNPFLKKFKKPF